MSFENSEPNDINKQVISIKKSVFRGMILGIIITVGIAAFFAGSYTSNLNSEQVSQKELQDAISKLELKILQKQLQTSQLPSPVIISADNDPIIGDPNAQITIIEFSDFQCPFCARFNTQTLPSIFEEYISQGKVKLVFRDFPLGFHAEAKPAAIAANCADKQGKFWEYHDKIFENQGLIGTSNYNAWAEELELDMDAYVECLVDPEVAAEIEADLQDGAAARNSGTPGFFIGVSSDDGTIEAVQVVGSQPFAAFKSAIDQKLAEAAK